MRLFFRRLFGACVYGFALIGFVFVVVSVSVRLHLTDVSGTVDARSNWFSRQATQAQVLGASVAKADTTVPSSGLTDIQKNLDTLSAAKQLKLGNVCALKALKDVSPTDAAPIWTVEQQSGTDVLVYKMLDATEANLSDFQRRAFDRAADRCLKQADAVIADPASFIGSWDGASQTAPPSLYAWSNDDEWRSLAQAVVKDKAAIDAAAQAAGVEPRLIVASMVVEQTRLFHSERELFKKFFEPMKILGNSTVISLGVMGMKPLTAQAVEEHLLDTASPYYLGAAYEHLLDYPAGADIEQERFNRLTDDKNRSYAYLYGALYLRQFLEQWQRAGYDIRHRPEIIGTLFNVGFPQSHPKADPQVGGSTIKTDTAEYTFGRLSYEFYYSGRLLDAFPYDVR